MLYNPKYKSEVMNWDFKIFVDTVAAADCNCHGSWHRQGQEPADLSGAVYRHFVSNMGVWTLGPLLICGADTLSGYRIISFILDACAGRRRYQTVFRNWVYLESEIFVLLYVFFFSDRSCFFLGKAALSKKSNCTSDVFLPLCKEFPGK